MAIGIDESAGVACGECGEDAVVDVEFGETSFAACRECANSLRKLIAERFGEDGDEDE